MDTEWNVDLKGLLLQLGENLEREGLRGTPDRVERAWSEFLAGYTLDPSEILSTRFVAESPGVQACTNIEFSSMCEHHLLPFFGTAAIVYQPKARLCSRIETNTCPFHNGVDKICKGSYADCCAKGMVEHSGPRVWQGEYGCVVGLSKLTRLVDCFARRLQIQERMTQQIADSLFEYLIPVGVLVVCQAKHLCCHGRGVRRSQMGFKTTAQCGDVSPDFWRVLQC